MHINMIVQPRRIKPNDERFDLSLKDKPVKPPKSKHKKDFHSESVFDELELVMDMNTRSKSSHG